MEKVHHTNANYKKAVLTTLIAGKKQTLRQEQYQR